MGQAEVGELGVAGAILRETRSSAGHVGSLGKRSVSRLLPWVPPYVLGAAREAEVLRSVPSASVSHLCLKSSTANLYPFGNQIN